MAGAATGTRLIALIGAFLLLVLHGTNGFSPYPSYGRPVRNKSGAAGTVDRGQYFVVTNIHKSKREATRSSLEDGKEYWLDEFATASGEILDPYQVLKLKKDAGLSDIKKAYRDESRRFHPDQQRFRDVLPGSCNNQDEVRDQWERIKLAYEILKNPKSRKRYDRHLVLSDPGAAVGRAVTEATLNMVGSGLKSVGKGLWDFTGFAMEQIKDTTTETTHSTASSRTTTTDATTTATPAETVAEESQ